MVVGEFLVLLGLFNADLTLSWVKAEKITLRYKYSMYAAPKIMPLARTSASQNAPAKSALNKPSKTRNSPTKPDVPGNPEFARANSIMNAANMGMVLTTPP